MEYITINKLAKNSIYKQIASSISEAIDSALLKYNDRLPTEKELCEIYAISQTTVKRAYNKLIDEGKIRRIKGKGTFVTNRNTYFSELRAFYQFDILNLAEYGMYKKEILVKERVSEDFGAYRALKINYGEVSYVLKVIFKDKANPVLFQKIYLPEKYFPNFEKQFNDKISLFDFIEKTYGYKINNLHSTFSTTNASSAEAIVLNISTDDAIYFVRTIITDKDKNIIAYICNYFPGEFTEFEVIVHAN